jgi:hypothetical protein
MAGPQEELFTGKSAPADGTVAVNARCLVRTQGGHRVVLVAGIVLCQYAVGDRMAEAHAMVSLVEQGWAEQRDVAMTFRCSSRTVRRLQRRFEVGGLPALARAASYPAGRPRLPKRNASPVGVRRTLEARALPRQGAKTGRKSAAFRLVQPFFRSW